MLLVLNTTNADRLGRFSFAAGMLIVAVALPLSNYLMSLGQFIMAGGWLLSAQLPARLRTAFRNPGFWLLTGLYLLHLAGLIHTEDMSYAMNDLRIKIPLWLMPLLFFSAPELPEKTLKAVLYSLMGGVAISNLAGAAAAAGWTDRKVEDFRDLSLFISHIRLSLLIVLSLALSVYFFYKERNLFYRLGLVIYGVWLTVFLFMIQSITGLLLCVVLILIFFGVVTIKARPPARILSAVLLLAGLYGSYSIIHYVFVDSLILPERKIIGLPERTARGNPYNYDTTNVDIEKGRYVWMQYNENEMDTAWLKRSSRSVWDKDDRGHMLLVTLARYLTYKGYGRDAEGIEKLTAEEVRQIESGYPTPEYFKSHNGLRFRLHELAREYRSWYYEGWASGHSLAQRLEYWKTARSIWSENPLIGVGTGDVQDAFDAAYLKNRSSLEEPYRKRAHNQYLTMAVTFGGVGFLYFLFLLIFLFRRAILTRDPLFVSFLVIAAGSFFSEDTLETQAGVTFFAFLTCLFLKNLVSIGMKEVPEQAV